MIRTGLDRLLEEPEVLSGRRYGLLTHLPAVSADLVPAHLALGSSPSPPERLFGPEHGLFGWAQDMEAAQDALDPWTGIPVVSLYGDEESSLRPDAARFEGLDLLIVDLQDIGARYYTYAATAVWAVEIALEQGCEVWVLDRPNPLGGVRVEGNLRRPGFESFVSAFETPVVHGLTLGELVAMQLPEGSTDGGGVKVWKMSGWERTMTWEQTGRPWLAPSPNMPSYPTAVIYPGLCLVEATGLSEGRGTTRPFHLIGGPRVDAVALATSLNRRRLTGVGFVPTCFRPQFQKHAGVECSGVELVITDIESVEGYRLGVEVLIELSHLPGFEWRSEPYEFVTDRPAVDLLTGDDALRRAIERGEEPTDWMASWAADEKAFKERRRGFLLYS